MLNTFPLRMITVKVSSGPNKSVFYPRVIGMQNQNLERFINTAIVHQIQELIDEQVGNMPTTVEQILGMYEIKNNQRQVLKLIPLELYLPLSCCPWYDVYKIINV